jgi:hypothetical protein
MPIQAAFTLNANEIYNTLANMIISQEVFGDNLGKHQTLIDKARVDGGLFGDKKLYYATDVLKSHAWGNDSEASNLLALDRPADPEVQDINLDTFRQIRLTLDNYLSKRAWSTEGAFASFTGIMLGWMRETKRVYEGTLYNAFIGTTETSTGSQSQTVDLKSASSGDPLYGLSGLEKYRMKASLIAQHLADLLVQMGDYSRAFNDYQYLRSYAEESIMVVWNSKFLNEIRKVDLPTIFHKEGLVDKFDQEVLPERYFGRSVAASDKGSGKVINASDAYDPTKGTIRSRIEADVTVGGVAYHVFAGDEIPSGATVKSGGNFEEAQVYVATEDVICKVLVKLPPIMSAFEVGTTFFNPRSLTENHYLTWGHNTLKYFKNYPFITVKADE